jgi:pimeloyl-ACP methyl ester carboxylesterase
MWTVDAATRDGAPTTDGPASLHCVVRGSGEPLVLVHGSSSDVRSWDGQIDGFAESFRVWAYSRRYHWPNPPLPDGEPYDMRRHVGDLETLMDRAGQGPVHLVGHSYGAFMCLLAAIRRPERVASLVLAEPPVLTLFTSDPPRPPELLRLLLTRPRAGVAIMRFGLGGVVRAQRALRKGDPDGALRAFGSAVLGKKSLESLSPERWQQARDNFIAAELEPPGFPPIGPGCVRKVQAPTLLVNGARSPALFRHFADRLEGFLSDVERVRIPDASHMMHEDNPGAFADAVSSFLVGRALASRSG